MFHPHDLTARLSLGEMLHRKNAALQCKQHKRNILSFSDKPAFQGRFQAVVAPGLHCGGTVAPVIGAGAAPDMGIALGAQAAGEASSGNAGSRLAKKSP
jgi:hypothetical protein